ncbi:MAG: hypothetical protein PF518_11130 [Spirochaetaceae bacterium]|jgi:hypothetical protein|nr:hypothetical protein [Spirochaetaceae bacterium]
MLWIYRNTPKGFEDLSLAEMLSSGLTQVSKRFFTGTNFDLSQSAYASFTVREVSRGSSPEDAIINFKEEIPSPYRMEKIGGKRRAGSMSFALLAEKHLGGDIRAAQPASIILVFTPDKETWIAGFVTEKENSVIDELKKITERTCVSLTSQAALAMVNLVTDEPIVDPCCGTGLIPLASLLRKKNTYTADNNYKMLRMARINRDILNLDIEMAKKDAMMPWIKNGCLITDFPAERSWVSNTKDISMEIFKVWIPYIKSFCVIFPNKVLDQLPENIEITGKINFTAERTILLGTVNHQSDYSDSSD